MLIASKLATRQASLEPSSFAGCASKRVVVAAVELVQHTERLEPYLCHARNWHLRHRSGIEVGEHTEWAAISSNNERSGEVEGPA